MLKTLAVTAPGVDSTTLIATGVSDIRDVFPADQIPGILVAYMHGLRIPFAIATAPAGAAFILTCFVIVVPARGGKKADRGGGSESNKSSDGIKG